MYIEALLLGFLVGGIRNGRLSHFNAARFKGWGLAFFAFILFVVPYGLHIVKIPFEGIQWLPYAAMCLVVLIALFNFSKTGMKLIALGAVLNLLVMGLHGGLMPIDLSKMDALGYTSFTASVEEGMVLNHMDAAEGKEWVVLLGKVIPMPSAYPLARVISIGDIIVSIGIVVLIQGEMQILTMRTKSSMVQFGYRTKIK